MKKLFALAALVLGLASCQTEPEGFGVVTGGEVDTVVTVSLPAATRSSEQSGLENIDLGTYDIRYIFEVYDAADDAFVIRQEQKCDDTTVSFPVRLIPSRDYYFVVWADFVKGDEACYNVESLKNVSIIESTWTAMNEVRDAYTGVIKVENYNGSKQIDDIVLTRPFGKLRVVTTDMDALTKLNNSGLASVKVTYDTQVGMAFNALDPAVTTPVYNKEFTYNLTNAGVYGETGNNLTLFADYIFAQGTSAINFNMDVIYTDGKTSTVTFNTDIPVVRNQLTTIIGSILTDANDVKVVVDDKFAAKNTILDVFENGGEYTLTENIELPANNLIVKKDVVLNLGDYTINAGKPDSAEMTGTDIAAITVVDGATLTIEGNGTIMGTEYGVYVKNGHVVIKGGNFVAGTSAVQVYEGTATIEGGKFEAEKSDVYVVNCIDANWKNKSAQVAIKGGEFKNFNPQNNAAEGVGTCFVADGYISVPAAEYFKVVPFKDNFTLENNVEVSKLVVTEDVTLNLNGNTLKGGQAYDASKGMTGIDISAITVIDGATLTIEGEGTIKGADYGVYAKEGTLIIKGGNFECEWSAVQVANAEVNIYGGTFSNTDDDKRYTINCLDADWKNGNARVNIYGGSYKDFNPANNAAEGANTNFCAEGYGVFENDDWFEVLYTGGESTINAVVNNADELNAAMAQGGVIILAEGEFGTIVAKSDVTLVGTPEAKVDVVVLNGAANLTLRNITFDAATAKYGYDFNGTKKVWAYSNIITGDETNKPTIGARNLTIDGCEFTGSDTNGGSAIAFTDQGRKGGYSDNITIKNCKFAIEGAYYHIYGHYMGNYGYFVLENNVFETNVTAGPVYLGRYTDGKNVTVKGNHFKKVDSLEDAVYVQSNNNIRMNVTAENNIFGE
ncbi:MAG: hypothetical protein IKW36_08630 [Alistipes sp.]|nr:hypothetical protein [Alistipes sp.]